MTDLTATIRQIEKDYDHSEFRTLISYYLTKVPDDGTLPRLTDIEVMDIYPIARNLVILDLEGDLDERPDFRYRFAGSGLREPLGLEMTGKSIREFFGPAALREAGAIYADALRRRQPHVWHRTVDVSGEDRSFIAYDRVILPLCDADAEARHLIGIYVFI